MTMSWNRTTAVIEVMCRDFGGPPKLAAIENGAKVINSVAH
jgi:hypothetical protein